MRNFPINYHNDFVWSFKLDLNNLDFTNPLIAKAFEFCVTKHAGQKRKCNKRPYFFHPLEVANYLSRYDYLYYDKNEKDNESDIHIHIGYLWMYSKILKK